ncbi:MAG: tellurite resistance TerB family protein [Cyanobacteriota bacterium]|nr:tellurite resistance TerB family protein [Cyanobacteriota bacterium]
MDTATAFAAIAVSAVSWDGTLSMAGSRALRHTLDYRKPFSGYQNEQMANLLDEILSSLRHKGAQHLMVEAAETLSASQRHTAYAMAAEIMRSDGPLVEDEHNILANLAAVLDLDEALTEDVKNVMNILHADLLT